MISTYTAYQAESFVTSAIIMGMATATRPPIYGIRLSKAPNIPNKMA